MRNVIEKQVKEAKSQYLKFIFVRHPFSRLVSAYSDKFQIPAHRFEQAAVEYANDLLRKNSDVFKYMNGHKYLIKIPTFKEFVNFILETPMQRLNNHWTSMTRRCQPCAMDYDIIGKVETIEQDVAYITKKMNVSIAGFPHLNVSNSTSRTKNYITSLPVEIRYKLYDKFKDDFIMFSYTMEDYN